MHYLLHSQPPLGIRDLFSEEGKKNQLVLNLFMDFCDQCKSTQRGSLGPSSSQLMCLKGNYHWCCFPFLAGQRASWGCHGPPATWVELLSTPPRCYLWGNWTANKMACSGSWCGEKKIRLVVCAESNMSTVRESSTKLIVNPIKAGNTTYWLTSLNTHNKQTHTHTHREYSTCKFIHTHWLSHPQIIHIMYCSSQCSSIMLVR